MKFRYDTSGQWFKGNTHLHSTASDGGKTFAESAELYASAGYGFLYRTDHWVASDTTTDSETYPLLWLDGIELDGHDDTGRYYHVVCLSVDDAHLSQAHPGWNGGWITVNAEACTNQHITQAIRCGNYYSSCGPELQSIKLHGNELQVTTSPVQFVRLVGPGPCGDRLGSFDGGLITEASLTVPEDWDYAYLEVQDELGRRAWTNTLYVSDNKLEHPPSCL